MERKDEKMAQPSSPILSSEVKPILAQPQIQQNVVNEAEPKANPEASPVATEKSEAQLLAIDTSGQSERVDGDDLKKADGMGEPATVESKVDANNAEIINVVNDPEQKERESSKVNNSTAAKNSADPDITDSDSNTEEDATTKAPPLLTIEGNNIVRHSDTTKEMFAQLVNSDDLTKHIARKDFVQYFRKQGATNLTCRRLYTKFNPKNSAHMDYDEFQSNVLAHTQKAEEEAK